LLFYYPFCDIAVFNGFFELKAMGNRLVCGTPSKVICREFVDLRENISEIVLERVRQNPSSKIVIYPR
jgi:hypothetical protein